MALLIPEVRIVRYGLVVGVLVAVLVSAIAVMSRDRLSAQDVQASSSGAAAGAPSPSGAPPTMPAAVEPKATDHHQRVEIVSDHAVPREAPDEEPRNPVPEPRRLGFHRHPLFASASECARDPRFNPTSAELDGDDLARLESIIAGWNRNLNDLEAAKIELAESLARGLIHQGLATPVESGVQVPAVAGSITVTVAYDGAHSPQRVVIQPGDFAELDLIAVEIESVVEAGHSEIQEFFASL